jgi:hypothetical protein
VKKSRLVKKARQTPIHKKPCLGRVDILWCEWIIEERQPTLFNDDKELSFGHGLGLGHGGVWFDSAMRVIGFMYGFDWYHGGNHAIVFSMPPSQETPKHVLDAMKASMEQVIQSRTVLEQETVFADGLRVHWNC